MLSKLPSGQDALLSAYEAIEKTVHDVDAYVRVRTFLCHLLALFIVCLLLQVTVLNAV